MNEQAAKALYDNLRTKAGYTAGEAEFYRLLQEEQNRQNLYNNLKQRMGYTASPEEFEARLGFGVDDNTVQQDTTPQVIAPATRHTSNPDNTIEIPENELGGQPTAPNQLNNQTADNVLNIPEKYVVQRPQDYPTPQQEQLLPQVQKYIGAHSIYNEPTDKEKLAQPYYNLTDEQIGEQLTELQNRLDEPMRKYYDEFKRRTGRDYKGTFRDNLGLRNVINDLDNNHDPRQRQGLDIKHAENEKEIQDRIQRLRAERLWRNQQKGIPTPYQVADGAIAEASDMIRQVEEARIKEATAGLDPQSQSYLYAYNSAMQSQDPTLRAAKNLLSQARNRMADPKKSEYHFGDFTSTNARYLLASQEGIASFGLSNLSDAREIVNVFTKVDENNAYNYPEQVLNPQEYALYQAYISTLAAEMARMDDTSSIAKAGKMSADMIQFMEEMMLQSKLWSGLSKTAANRLSRFVVSKVEQKLLEKTGKKWLAKGVAGAIYNTGETALRAGETAVTALLLPRTYANAVQNTIQVANTDDAIFFDGNKLRIGEFETDTNTGAFLTAWRDQWKEMFTETGGAFKFVGNLAFKNPLMNKFYKSVGKTKLGHIFDAVSKKGAFNFLNEVGYNGVGAEWLEEVEGASWEYLFGDKKAFSNFFSKEQQLPMLISFSLPALFGGAVNAGRESYYLKHYDKALSGLRKQLQQLGYSYADSNQMIADLKNNIYLTDINDLPKTIQDIATTLVGTSALQERNAMVDEFNALTEKPNRTEQENARYTELYKSIIGNQAQTIIDNLTQLVGAETALAGLNNDMAKEYHKNVETARTQQREYNKEQQAEQIRQQAEQDVSENAHKGNGQVYLIADATDEERHGYIVDGDTPTADTDAQGNPILTGDTRVTVKWDDGTVEQLSTSQLNLLAQPQATEDAVNQLYEQRLQQQQLLERSEQMFPVGTVVSFTDPNTGYSSQSPIVSITADGVEVQAENEKGEPDTTIIPHEIAQQALVPVPTRQPKTPTQQPQELDFVRVDENNTELIKAIDNGNGTVTLLDENGNPTGEPLTPQDLISQGIVPLEQAPYDNNDDNDNDNDNNDEPEQTTTYKDPDPETQSGDELGVNAVEAFGNQKDAIQWLNELLKDAQKEENKPLPKDFQSRKAELDRRRNRVEKLQTALATANRHKTQAQIEQEQAEAERRAKTQAENAERRRKRRELDEVKASQTLEERWKNTKKTVGANATKTLPNGQVVKGHYILTEAGDIIPSHDPRNNYKDSEGYLREDGTNINDNDYKDLETQKIAMQMAQKYGGQAVEQMPFVENLAGRVLSGNNRTISGIIAAQNNTDQAYLQALADNLSQFGFTTEQLAEYKHPRLQFVVEDELPFTTATFALFNSQEKKTKNSTARAITNSKLINEAIRERLLQIIDNYNSIDAFFQSEQGAADIVGLLTTEGVMTQQEVAGLTEKTNTGFIFNDSGKDYVTDLLLGTLFDEQTIKLLGNDKALKRTILRALPMIVENRQLGDYALTDNINGAIRLLYEMRNAGMTFDEFIRQTNAFEGAVSDRYSAFEMLLAEEMQAGVEQFRKVLALYNQSAENEANGQTGMFEPRSAKDIKQEILDYYAKQRQKPNTDAQKPAKGQAGTAKPKTTTPVASTQAGDGQVEPTDKQGNPLNSDGTLKLEQVESIDQLTDEDFTKPSRSVQLPELAKPVNDAIGAKGKTVVIKKNIFEKNLKAHAKLTPEDSRKILNTALYNPNLYGQNQKTTRPNNWILIHIAETNTAVLLEVAENKDNVEIISWHYLDDYGILKKQNQAIKEGGQILKFSTNPVADTANDDLISADKDTTNSANKQEGSEKKSEEQPKEQPKQESKNTIFTDEEAERIRARMKARRNRLNMGIDPEQFADGVFMAGYYVEKGMRKFADFARAMIKEFGDWVRPYLKQWYMGLRYDPRAVGQEFLKDMDDINTVDMFDVDNFKVEEPKNEKKPQASLQPWDSTPMGVQYHKIKEQYPDALLLFRVGDFYEMYSADAEEGSKILGITLTKRSGGKDGIPMAGFPFHALDTYLPKLVRAGKRVAICDQLEDPKQAKNLVKRGVTELVSGDGQTEQPQNNSDKPLHNEKKAVSLQDDAEPKQEQSASVTTKGKTEPKFKVGDKVRFTDGKTGELIDAIVRDIDANGKYQLNKGKENEPLKAENILSDVSEDSLQPREDKPNNDNVDKDKKKGNKKGKGNDKNDDQQQLDLFADAVEEIKQSNEINNEQRTVSQRPQRGNGGVGEEQQPQTVRPDTIGVDNNGGEHRRDDGVRSGSVSESLHQPTVKKNTHNFRNKRGNRFYATNSTVRIKDNVEAIRTLRELQESGKKPTKEQQDKLARFTGWGGLGSIITAAENERWSPLQPLAKELKDTLLSEDEWQALINASRTAFYTPVEIIDTLWDVAKRLGFKGGKVLEGSAGIGNILGQMPTDISNASDLQAVEYDPTTAAILSYLYPDAQTHSAGFQDIDIKPNSVDLAITNVPFGKGNTFDKNNPDLNFSTLQDFCIAKNVRALKEGGIAILISTSGTLENSPVRNWITTNGNADIIGAFRLNNATFGEATDVTSDIIIIRKRINGEKSSQAIDVMSTGIGKEYKDGKGKVEARVAFNQYFIDHPEFMGGEMDFVSRRSSRGVDRYGKKDSTVSCFPIDETTQARRLTQWEKTFQAEEQATASKVEIPDEDAQLEDCNIPDALVGSMQIDSKGRVCQVTPAGKMKPLAKQDKVRGYTRAQCVREYQQTLKALDDLLAYQQEHHTDEGLQPLLQKLNLAFNSFRRHFGTLRQLQSNGKLSTNSSLAWLRRDTRWADFSALEIAKKIDNPDGTTQIKFETPSVMTQRVVQTQPAFKPQNNKDGAILSIQQKGILDLDFIAQQLGKTKQQVRGEMLQEGIAFADPITDELVISYEYLSGNVREKLKEAEAKSGNGKYDKNIEELKKRLPISIPFHLINITCGATYIPESIYVDFLAHKLGSSESGKEKIKVHLVNGSLWVVDNKDYDTYDTNNTLGVYSSELNRRWTFDEIFTAALHDKTIQAKGKRKIDKEEVTIYDQKAQEQLLQKIEDVKEEFVEWYKERMQSDSEVAGQLETIYNERYNNFAPLRVTNDFIPSKYEGQTSGIELRGYQKHAVAKAVAHNTMIAHEVGTGKTFTMITTAMEMRRLGMAKKPMIVVQKATIGQFAQEAKRLYPNAKVLALNKDFDGKEGRKEFLKQIKYNNWDIVIITQPALDKIPDSPERQKAYISEKIQEIQESLELAKEQKADDKVIEQLEKQLDDAILASANISIETEEGGIGKKKTAAELKKEAEKAETVKGKAQRKLDRSIDDVKDFDDLGIDALFVDEAHAYKKLGFSTLSSRDIRGIDSSASKRAVSLYLKTKAIYDRAGGYKNVIFATGTPITNTAAECWTYMRYLMPKEQLQKLGIHLFDAFRKTFGEIVSQGEMKTSGQYQETKRFSKYNNVAELLQIWSQIADTVLQPEENKKYLPKTITATETNDQAPNDVFLKMTSGAKAIIKWVYSEYDRYNAASKKEQYEMTRQGFHLKMFKIAKMAAIDIRLVSTDPNTPDEPGNKTNQTVEMTLKALEKTKAYRGTVAIFCDKYRNTATGFNVFEEMKRKLIEAGVPENEIAIVSGKELSDDKKTQIFDDVREGKIRVIMGTTQRMGIGVNIQDRLQTLIHMDAPDMPMEYTQRNGRIIRQGNEHAEWGLPVDIVRLGVERSLDTSAFQRLKTKNGFIEPFMNQASILTSGKEIDPLAFRLLEEDSGIFDNPVAELSGSSFLQAKTDAVKQLRKLTNEKASFEQTQNYARGKLSVNTISLQTWQRSQARYTKQLELIRQNFGEKGITTIAFGGKTVPFSDTAVQKVFESIRKEQTEINKDLASKSFGTVNSEYDIQINGNNVHILITKERVYEGSSYVTHTTIAYKCPELFGDEAYHKGYQRMTALPHLIEDIQTQINISKIEGWKDKAESEIQRISQENEKYQKTLERTFDNSTEVEKIQKFIDELDIKIEAEIEAARKELNDVQQVDANSITADFEEDSDEPEAQYDELEYSSRELTEAERLAAQAEVESLLNNAGLQVTLDADEAEMPSDAETEFSIRQQPAPKKTGIGYKVFYRGKDGKLYPPMVANPNGADTPIGVWLDADAAPIAGESKTGRPQVKAGGKGTQGGSGQLAYRPGWHLGEIPYALQFNRKDENGEKTLFPKDFVWAEVEYAADVDYQQEAEQEGMTENGKYRHSYAGLKHLPTNGFYRYRTNPNPETDPWIITGAMKVNRVLSNEEVDEIVRRAGREPQQRELSIRQLSPTQKQVATDVWNKYQYDGELESIRDVAEYLEENMPQDENTTALFNAIDRWRKEEEEDRLYYGERGDLEPFEDAILDEVERLMNVKDSEREPMKAGGRLFGWAQGNHIHLTKDGFNPNTPVHEYSHLWIKAIKKNNRELYDNLMDLFSRKNLPQMYEELDNDPNYADLTEEGKMSEVFARFSGKRGAQRMTEEAQAMLDDAIQNGTKQKVAQTATLIQRMKALLKKAWDWIGEHLFNIKNFGSREEAADRILYDLLNHTNLNLKEKTLNYLRISAPIAEAQDNQELNSAAKIVKNFENPKLSDKNNNQTAGQEETDIDDTPEFSISTPNPQRDTRNPLIVKTLIAQANDIAKQLKTATLNNQTGDNIEQVEQLQNNYNKFMQAALNLLSNDLKGLEDATELQKTYDKSITDTLTAYLNLFVASGWTNNATQAEMRKLIKEIGNGATTEHIETAVQAMFDTIANMQLRQTKNTFNNLLKTRLHKLNISGVREQAGVDIRTQYALKELQEAINPKNRVTLEQLTDKYWELIDKAEQTNDNALKQQYEAQAEGVLMAQTYFEEGGIAQKEQEAEKLKQELKDARNDTSVKGAAKRELVESIRQAIKENQQEIVALYQQMNSLIGGFLGEGHEKAKEFLENQKKRQQEIRHFANSDLKSVSPQEHITPTTKQKIANSVAVSGGLFSPLGSLNSMLKRLAPHALYGEGYLYEHFMRGIVKASGQEADGLQEAFKQLDDKVSEIWGKKGMSFADAEEKMRKLRKFNITVIDYANENGETHRQPKTVQITQPQAAYIYMCYKMTDGKMKLNKMGLTEEDINFIRDNLDPRLVKLCDWIQQVFLTEKRNKYNAVHEQMFGAPMAAIENYFPLRLVKTSYEKKADVADNNSENNNGQTSGTTTGAIKQRTRNALPLDILNSDVFSVLVQHLQEMEHWAAFAQITRDANQLLSYNTFKRRLNNMATAYGAGSNLYHNLKNAFKLALGTYQPAQDKASAFTAQVAKGLSIGAISFRINTALKQVLSHPAYLTEITHPVFLKEYAKNLVHPYGAVKWALQNLPLLRKRWTQRNAGDTRVLDNESDWKRWHSKLVEWSTRIGMTPNALIDMITCAQGAKAYYEYKYSEYRKIGLSDIQSKERAIIDAEIYYNETQQSSEGAFIAPIQKDRSWVAIVFSLYNNANIAYQRRAIEHITQLWQQVAHKQEFLDFNAKKYQRLYKLTEEEAMKKAKSDFNHAIVRNIIGIATFNYIIQAVWRWGSNWMYQLTGGDDDEKKKLAKDAALNGAFATPVRGLVGGRKLEAIIDAYSQGTLQNDQMSSSPLEQGIKTVLNDISLNRTTETINDIIDVLVASGIGIRPTTFTNIIYGVYDTVHAFSEGNEDSKLETAREFILLCGRIISAPQSTLDKIYIDELGCTGQELENMLFEGDANKLNAVTERYIRYKSQIKLPLTNGKTFDDEQDEKLYNRYNRRFNNIIDSRYSTHFPDEEEVWDDEDIDE